LYFLSIILISFIWTSKRKKWNRGSNKGNQDNTQEVQKKPTIPNPEPTSNSHPSTNT
jgi:hypothetical protein